VAAIKKLGFSEVMEDAFGAELVGLEYARYLSRNKEGPIISSNCPAVAAGSKLHTLVCIPLCVSQVVLGVIMSLYGVVYAIIENDVYRRYENTALESRVFKRTQRTGDVFTDEHTAVGELLTSVLECESHIGKVHVRMLPEVIRNDLAEQRYTLQNVSLAVFDEAHRCVKDYAYSEVAEAYKKQATNQLVLALTASPRAFLMRLARRPPPSQSSCPRRS
jgi:hypothetical protein